MEIRVAGRGTDTKARETRCQAWGRLAMPCRVHGRQKQRRRIRKRRAPKDANRGARHASPDIHGGQRGRWRGAEAVGGGRGTGSHGIAPEQRRKGDRFAWNSSQQRRTARDKKPEELLANRERTENRTESPVANRGQDEGQAANRGQDGRSGDKGRNIPACPT